MRDTTEPRFVLWHNHIDGNAFLAIGINEFTKVAGIGIQILLVLHKGIYTFLITNYMIYLLFRIFFVKWQRAQIFIEITLEQTVLNNAIFFEFCLRMKYRLFMTYTSSIV